MARLETRTRAPRFEAAIVDLDGTMIDTLGDFTVALNAMLRDLDLPGVDARAVETFVGRGSEHLIRCVLDSVQAPASLYERAWDAYQAHYLAINGQHSHLYPGVVEGLQGLRAAGLRLACLTNKPGGFAGPLLQAKEIAAHFDFVFGGDAFERKKPDPLPILRTCEALGVAPLRTLVVGDSSNDAQAARAAGCAVALVTYGYNHGAPVRGVDADAFVDSLAQLPAWIAAQALPSSASFNL